MCSQARFFKSQTYVLFLSSFQGCHLFLTWRIKTFSMIWVFAKIGAWGDVSARCAKPMKPIRLQITQLILTISFLDSFSKPTNLIFWSKYIISKSLIFPLYYRLYCQRSMSMSTKPYVFIKFCFRVRFTFFIKIFMAVWWF